MPNPPSDPPADMEELERELLCALCSPHTAVTTRRDVIRKMTHYAWLDEEHRVVFNALLRLRGRELEDVRMTLPAVTTRMGFPDVNWENFFDNEPLAETELAEVARALLAATRSEPRR